tara:strand:+ start:43 stop:231 length:189 start_codon:yes stop_codon:yes gene_type:complete
MKLELIKNKENETTGYKLIPETETEKYNINEIRNNYFFGSVKYDGREGGCSKFAGNLKFKFK